MTDLDKIQDLVEDNTSLRQQLAEAQRMLAECYRLSGADPDGNEDWRLAGRAIDAVKHLRERLEAAEQQVATLTEALETAMAHVPEARRTHKRFIKVDEAAGSTYELVDAEWWKEAQAALAAVRGECRVSSFSSRMCELGTKGCDVRHDAALAAVREEK